MKPVLSLLALSLCPCWVLAEPKPVPGLKVPPGFVVTEYADHTLANDIYCMTIDPKGRIVVSGRGYTKILVDDDDDGRADRAIDFADSPKDGAMGLLWEKDTLYVTGDGGLRRFLDKDEDDKADGPSQLIKKIKTGGEHTAHAIKRGPDGWLYVLCGDGAGIDKSYATTKTSPVKEPIGGCVIRFSPDLKDSEIVAHGFRNAYGMDFDAADNLFTFDSDNERCQGLPWYEPTRFYHVVQGRFYGWLAPQHAAFWRMPPYYFDVMPAACQLGRGSPTGVVSYHEGHFPERYQGMFALDWTFGKIFLLRPKAKGASFEAKAETFLEATGANGFAPTAALVHPRTGDLFVSAGGRGTRGAVYRIMHPESRKPLARFLGELNPIPREKQILGPFPSSPPAQLARLNELRQAVALGHPAKLEEAVRHCWTSHDRALRWAASALLRDAWPKLPVEERQRWQKSATKPSERLVLAAALATHSPEHSVAVAADILEPDHHPQLVVDALRIVQIALGDVGARKARGTYAEGYSLREEKKPSFLRDVAEQRLVERLIPLLQAESPIDLEAARVLALLSASSKEAVTALVFRARDEPCLERRLHFTMALARLESGGDPLVNLLHVVREAERDQLPRETNWALRLKEVWRDALARAPEIPAIWVSIGSFGEPSDLFFLDAPGLPRKQMAARLLKRLESADYPLLASMAPYLNELPARDIVPLIRKRARDAAASPIILSILARQPELNDYPLFVTGLTQGGRDALQSCLEGLNQLPTPKEKIEVETLALLRAMAVLSDKDMELRNGVLDRLERITRHTGLKTIDAWRSWFRKTHPDLAAKLDNPDGVDVAAWEKRLAKIDWDKGDLERGKKVFAKASCAQCHGGSSSVGPDLAGVAGRFSRADLFTAMLQPSRDVADRYRTTLVESKDGKTYQGLVIYDAVDSLILHTREGATVRLLGGDIAERRQVDVSPMPSGLLEALSDEEIADLYAFLRAKK